MRVELRACGLREARDVSVSAQDGVVQLLYLSRSLSEAVARLEARQALLQPLRPRLDLRGGEDGSEGRGSEAPGRRRGPHSSLRTSALSETSSSYLARSSRSCNGRRGEGGRDEKEC